MSPEPPPSQHGLKTAAGMKLTRFLRQIADEKTECMDLSPETGKDRMISKAEALARIIWRLALGYEEEFTKVEEGRVVTVKKYHYPNPKFVDIVYDRIEGKVVAAGEAGTKKQPLSGKLNDEAKKRLNSMAGESE